MCVCERVCVRVCVGVLVCVGVCLAKAFTDNQIAIVRLERQVLGTNR